MGFEYETQREKAIETAVLTPPRTPKQALIPQVLMPR
jgi:hypothetical protein